MTHHSVTLDREAFKSVASAIRYKLKRRLADQRRTPWRIELGSRDLTQEEIDRLRRALEVFEAEIAKSPEFAP